MNKDKLREEFSNYLRDNWDEREILPVDDWWLDKMEQREAEIIKMIQERIKIGHTSNFNSIGQALQDIITNLNKDK